MRLLFCSEVCHRADLVHPPDPQAHSAVCETNQYFKHKSLCPRIYMHVSGQEDLNK